MAGPQRERRAGYSNHALGQAFDNIADIFAPPSATDIYAYTRAGAEREKAQRLSDFYANRNTMTPDEFDRTSAALGLNPVTQGYAKLDVDRRGQDQTLEASKYHTDVEANTSRANNTDTNRAHLAGILYGNIAKDAMRPELPKSVADMFGLPPIPAQTGVISTQPGEKNYVPQTGGGYTTLEGNPKPKTEAEVKGDIIAGLSDEEKHAIGLGNIPQRPVYGYTGGTARVEPVTGKLVNTQTGEDVPSGSAATNLGAPHTTVNVGPSGEPFGNPPANMAWKRNPDGTVALDERGAPIALPITGTPLADKQKATADKLTEAEKQRQTQSGIVTQDIDRAIAAIKTDPSLTSGVGAQITQGVGGTPARNVKALLDSVKANVAFDRLQQMRAASPTGGALGQVSDKENSLLQSTLGSLDQAQDDKQLIENLKRVKDVTLDIVHGQGQGPARSYERTATNKDTNQQIIERNGVWGAIGPDGKWAPFQ